MSNHRPKSLSELNNVYDKAMRAEKAIKEGSSLLSTPEKETAPKTENIFEQLESRAAEAQRNQVFDPDITNIANDFLKRYAQPEKPKPAPQEIKRPAPTIQSIYHSAVKPKQEEKQDVSLNLGSAFASTVPASSAPVHRPAPSMPAVPSASVKAVPKTDEETKIAEEPKAAETFEPTVIYQAPETEEPLQETPVDNTPAAPKAPTRAPQSQQPRKAPGSVPSRVRITSTERSELMEEYMRVMSDDDDEPSQKKSKFSFFKKKKKHEDEAETESATNLYDELPDDEDDSADEVPVVAFDSSDVQYTDEYSDAPVSDDESPITQQDMNIYDYIEADFDYEEDEDATLDISTSTFENDSLEDIAEEEVVESEESIEETTEETTEEAYEAPTEEVAETVPVENEDSPAEEVEDAENVVYPTEDDEAVVYPDAPPADMVFDDIFSVSDESKRSYTGGNWQEVFGETNETDTPETEEISPETEIEADTADEVEADDTADNAYMAVATETDDESEIYDSITEAPQEDIEEDFEEENDSYKPKKGRGFAIFLMVLVMLISFIGAGATTLISTVVDINSGKIFADSYRAFTCDQSLADFGIAAGDLIIVDNRYANIDDVFVYADGQNQSFGFGKVTSTTTNFTGDYLYVTETAEGAKLINRDTSMGVVISTYNGVGTVLSLICDYSIFIVIAFFILIVAMIVCIALVIRKRRFDEIDESYDNNLSDDDSDNSYGDDDTDESEEDYSDYDADGIEQGLFVSI